MPVSFTGLNTQFVDLKTGMVTWTWLKIIQQWQTQLAGGFDPNGNLIGNIDPTVEIFGRGGTIGSILENLGDTGIITPAGLPAATPTEQGAVVLPAGASSNVLGTAAIQPSTAFDPAGAAAAAQTAAETFATTAANAAQTNAENFSKNASNLSTGTVAIGLLPGINAVITTAALTVGGTQGSMTFVNGLLTNQVPAT